MLLQATLKWFHTKANTWQNSHLRSLKYNLSCVFIYVFMISHFFFLKRVKRLQKDNDLLEESPVESLQRAHWGQVLGPPIAWPVVFKNTILYDHVITSCKKKSWLMIISLMLDECSFSTYQIRLFVCAGCAVTWLQRLKWKKKDCKMQERHRKAAYRKSETLPQPNSQRHPPCRTKKTPAPLSHGADWCRNSKSRNRFLVEPGGQHAQVTRASDPDPLLPSNPYFCGTRDKLMPYWKDEWITHTFISDI